MTKSDREIMEILEAFDSTGCAHSAAQLAGCDPKTVRRYVALREAGGGDPLAGAAAEEGYTGAAAVYGRDGGATGPYLVTTILHMPDDGEGPLDVLGCYLYDFEAGEPLDPAPITARFDEDPASVEDQPGVIVSQAWDIESLDGVWELRSTFIPEGSPGVDVTGFAGRVLILTSIAGQP